MRTLHCWILVAILSLPAAAANFTIFYGDNDGFGVGATTFKDPTINSAGIGEAAGTDIRLIGTGFSAPGFAPTSTLSFGAIAGITSIQITLSMNAFGGDISPVDGPNSIVLDGLAIPVSFLGSFSSLGDASNPNIETRSAFLPATFFPLFADGSVNLTGTRITEAGGAQSFQIDYLRFDVSTDVVPEPGTLGVVGLGLTGLGWLVRRRASARSRS